MPLVSEKLSAISFPTWKFMTKHLQNFVLTDESHENVFGSWLFCQFVAICLAGYWLYTQLRAATATTRRKRSEFKISLAAA